MKVSELNGAQLDYWVAKAERVPVVIHHGDLPKACKQYRWDKWNVIGPYNPSGDWQTGGPIIEREGIGSHKGLSSTKGQPWEAWANREGNPERDICYTGATLLDAAMRCFVASKFGDTVEE